MHELIEKAEAIAAKNYTCKHADYDWQICEHCLGRAVLEGMLVGILSRCKDPLAECPRCTVKDCAAIVIKKELEK